MTRARNVHSSSDRSVLQPFSRSAAHAQAVRLRYSSQAAAAQLRAVFWLLLSPFNMVSRQL
jgi:hypothetical protein